jgi:DNA-binding transcriptional MerR regulator
LNKTLFPRDEFLAKFDLPEADFGEWEKLKLVRPVGFSEDKVPLYSEDTVERIKHVKKLAALGYENGDIQKILKKVGLPKVVRERAKSKEEGQFLTIGHLAEHVGLSPRTIKHWEDKGIIEPDMRSEGGFRLYSGIYVYLCELIRDLQLFGYTLDEIKDISDYFRYFLAIQENMEAFPKAEVSQKLEDMLSGIMVLYEKMNLLKKGIKRWEDLMKKKRKEILDLKDENQKRESKTSKGEIK